jgi:predicted nucleotidyltransferase
MIRFKKIPKDIDEKIESLGELFASDPNVVFAYLFGGLLKKRRNPLSDTDLAVFVKNLKALDYLALFGHIADILGTEEIDLVVLNRAPLSLAGRILQNRKVLIDKESFLRHRYESLILREFFDFTLKERDILKRRYGIG